MSAKMGRPIIGQPKIHDMKVRVDSEAYEKIIGYAVRHKITKAETVRRAIVEFFKKK